MNEQQQSLTYHLTGLHCGACVRKVSQALAPFAQSVDVSLKPMQVTLMGPTADEGILRQALEAVGPYGLGPGVEPRESPVSRAPPESRESTGLQIYLQTYRPLILIVGYILATSLLLQVGLVGAAGVSAMETMRFFMAGFFLVFSFFKLLDINAFADAYSRYDLLAMRWRGWGLIYPFVELGLGMAYLANVNPLATHLVTILVMGFSAVGVIQAVANKTQIQCACLGTVFKLPMSTVTIVEDVGMVLMAAVMLALI